MTGRPPFFIDLAVLDPNRPSKVMDLVAHQSCASFPHTETQYSDLELLTLVLT